MSERLPFRGLLEPLGFFLLAFVVRALPYPSLLQGGEGMVFFGNDAYYHARRVAHSVVHFPSVLVRDPYMNFPNGGEAIWPPTLDWFVAALVRLFVGAGDPEGMEQFLAWFPPVVGALTVVGVWWLVRRHFSRAEAVVAATFLAVLPAHAWYSQIGFFDHHVASALATLVLLAAAMELVSVREGDRGKGVARRSVFAGLALGGVLLVWPGCILHVLIVEAAFGVRVLTAKGREEAVAWGRRFAVANVVAGLVVWPFSASWEYWGSFSPLVLSDFQPAFFVAAAICFGALAESWMRVSRPSRPGLRWAQAAGLGVLVLAVFFSVFPGLSNGLADGWEWFAKAETFQADVAESKALFSEGFERPEELLTRFLYIVPFLLLAFGLLPEGRSRSASEYVFLGWAAVLALATAVQFRFMNSFSVAFAVLLAVTVVPWVIAFFRTRARTPGVRAVSIFVLAGVVLYAVAPIARTQAVHLRNVQAWALGEPVRPFYLARLQIVREQMARWLRGNSEPTAEGLFNGPQPEYAVLAPWSVGHVLKYVAERPVLHDNFGDDVAPENMQRVQRYFAAEGEAEALELIEDLPVRYVIVRDPDSARLRERRAFGMENRLFGFRGSGKWVVGEGGTTAPRQVKALERHRLVYESVPLWGKVGKEEALYRVFEIVPGAQITGRALPREVVSVRLSVRVRNRSGFEYQVRTRADEKGRWALRVPYANDGSVPGVDVGAFYTVAARSGSARVRIPETLVREGGTLEAPPLRAPEI